MAIIITTCAQILGVVAAVVFVAALAIMGIASVRDARERRRCRRELLKSDPLLARMNECIDKGLGWSFIAADTPYLTHPEQGLRFCDGSSPVRTAILLPCGARVMYIEEDSGCAGCRLAALKADYNAAIDVDRYAVVCPVGGADGHECPAWNAIRRALQFAKEERVGYKGRTITENIDEYGLDDAPHLTPIYKDNPFGSPCGHYVEPIGAAGVAEIVAASETCEYRSNNGGKRRDCGQDKSKQIHA